MVATALVRYSLMFTMYAALVLCTAIIFRRRRNALLALVSYPLIYLFAFYSHHDLTHTLLMATAIPVTLLGVLVAHRTGAWWGWTLAGLGIGTGVLAKYSFVVFAASLLMAARYTESYRSLLRRRGMLIATAIVLAVCGPFFFRLALVPDAPEAVADAVVGEDEAEDADDRLFTTLSMLGATVEFTLPFALIAIIIFPRLWGRRRLFDVTTDDRRLLGLQMLIGVILLVAVAPLLGFGEVRGRWMLPALMVLPLYLFLGADTAEAAVRPARERAYVWIMLAMSLLAVVARLAVDRLEPATGEGARRTLPVAALADPVVDLGFGEGQIVADTNHLAGNLVMVLPRAHVYSADPGQGPARVPDPDAPVLYVWRGESDAIPDATARQMQRLELNAAPEDARRVNSRFWQYPERPAVFTLLPAMPLGETDAGGM